MKNKWNIYYNDIIDQEIAYRKKDDGTFDVWTKDKTHYKQNEIDIIRKHGKYNNLVHIIKRMFCGKIIE